MPISHAFTSAIADDPTAAAAGQVLPSHWNAGHTLPAHTELSAIGTNTHAQIDTALTRLAGTSGSNSGDQDLSGLVGTADLRLSDSRTPTAHKASHATGQSDALAPSDIGAQATLVSGTNIKTVNSTSLLGSGDIAIGAIPGGADTQVQFNDGGAFGGDAGMTFNKTTKNLGLTGALVLTGPSSGFATIFGTAQYREMSLQLGFNFSGGQGLALGPGNASSAYSGLDPAGATVASDGRYAFGSTTLASAPDLAISRISAGLAAVGTGAQGSYAGDLKLRNLISSGGVITLSSFTVGTLPSASTSGAGALAMATDLISLVNGTTATTGGSLKGVCKSDGSAWIVLG